MVEGEQLEKNPEDRGELLIIQLIRIEPLGNGGTGHVVLASELVGNACRGTSPGLVGIHHEDNPGEGPE